MSNTFKTLWNDDYLKSFTQAMIESDSSTSKKRSLVFWYEDEKSGDIKINRHLLVSRFFPALGVHNLLMGKDARGMDSALPVFVNGNRVEEINGAILKSITFKVLSYFSQICGDNDTADEVRTALGFCKEIFESNGLRAIPDLYDKQVMKDTATDANRFFTNGWVTITKDGVSPLRSYDELPENTIIWNTSVIEQDYLFAEDVSASLHNLRVNRIHPITGEYVSAKKSLTALIKDYEAREAEQLNTPRDTHFRDFISNLAMSADGEVCPKLLERLKIAIGYLCHRHHFADNRRWVEIVDRDFDVSRKSANGGNGKSLLIQSLKNVMNVACLDGKEFKKGKSDTFAFANVTPATEICFFDDADEKFDTNRLYGRTTGDFHVRRMRQNPFTIEAKSAPKIVITSNYPLGNNDSSTSRRQFVVEVGSYYKDAREIYKETPCDIHGGKMIAEVGGGWDETDWSEYYRFIWECLSTYLAKGLPTNDELSDNFKRSQLVASFGCDDAEPLLDFYVDYLNACVESGDEVFAQSLYKDVRANFPNLPSQWDVDGTPYRQLKATGAAFKMNTNKWKNGNLHQTRIGKDNGGWKKWVDAGLDGTLKPCGNPFVEGDRVKVFSVSKLSKPTSVFSAPDFSKSADVEALEASINDGTEEVTN